MFHVIKGEEYIEKAYGMRCHGLICYAYGVQWHVRHDCLKAVQGANYRGIKLKNMWSRIFDHNGDSGMDCIHTLKEINLHISFDHDKNHRWRLKKWFSI